MLNFIVYTSDYSGTNINKDMADIRKASVRNNSVNKITGVLFHHQGRFLQAIEGEKQALEKLMLKIQTDVRHENIEVLIDSEILERSYHNWSLGTFNL